MELENKSTTRKKTSMSVREMGEILGLKKVESYWLIKQNFFKTIIAGKRMRVMIDSFEEWYAGQFHYKKVDGTLPGLKYGPTMSIQDVADELGIAYATAQALILNPSFERRKIDSAVRITRYSFEEWYKRQCHYRKRNGEQPGKAYGKTMSPREMSDLLGIKLRNTGYDLIARNLFRSYMVAGHRRIDVDSFEEWYNTQDHYKKRKE